MKKIKTEELQKKLKNNEVILIEVLEKEEYNKGHIKGAVNIPLKRISTDAREKYDKYDEIVVYCSDKNCEASPTAANKLKDSGFTNVYDYDGGKKAWKKAGLPMDK
jgi:rhodanese-related sulfurtransferase